MATKTETTKTQTAAEVQKGAQDGNDLVIPKEIDGLETKSAKIRALHAEGWTRSQIAKALNIRYQHVRNVLVTPLKKDNQ